MTIPILTYAPTLSDLRAIDTTKAIPGWICAVAGYWQPFDGGGDIFVWLESAVPDDGGYTIAAKGPGSWQRLDASGTARLNARKYGCKGDGQTDDTSCALALFKAIAAKLTSTPDGQYCGAGYAYFPLGVYNFSQSLQVPPHTIVEGDGRVTTSFVFNAPVGGPGGGDGFYVADPGENSNSNVIVRDCSVYNTNQANTIGAGVDFIGGGSNCVEHVDCTGWAFGAIVDGSDDTVISKCAFNASSNGMLGAISYGVWLANGVRHNRGNATVGATNNVVISTCTFNGPHVNVWHDDGVGHVVTNCNSEGGTLGLFTSANNVRHEGWTQEGQDVFPNSPLFHFAVTPGAIGEQYVADNIVIKDNFLGGSATQPTMLVDPYAAVGFLQWHRNRVASSPPGGVIQGAAGIENCIHSGPYPSTGPFFDQVPATATGIDHATLPLQCSVAQLPLGPDPAGQLGTFSGFPRFAMDGCKPGEAAGKGTGCPVYYSNGAWRRYSDDQPVTA